MIYASSRKSSLVIAAGFLAAIFAPLSIAKTPPYGFAWVSNYSDLVSFDWQTNTIVGRAHLGSELVDPTAPGPYVYVMDEAGDVEAVSAVTGGVAASIPVDTFSNIFEPAGSDYVYAVELNHPDTNEIEVISKATNSLVRTITLPYPEVSQASSAPGGRYIYLDRITDMLVFDTATSTTVADIPFGAGAAQLVFSSDGTLAAWINDNNLVIVSTSTNKVLANIDLGQLAGVFAVTADYAYLELVQTKQLAMLSISSKAIVKTVSFPSTSITLSPNGKFLYAVPAPNYNQLDILSPQTLSVEGTVNLGTGATVAITSNSITFSPDSQFAYLVSELGTLALSTANHQFISLYAGNGPFFIPGPFDETPSVESVQTLPAASATPAGPPAIGGVQVKFSQPITQGSLASLTGVNATSFSGLGTDILTWKFSPESASNLPLILAGQGANALRDASGTAIHGGLGFTYTLNPGPETGDRLLFVGYGYGGNYPTQARAIDRYTNRVSDSFDPFPGEDTTVQNQPLGVTRDGSQIWYLSADITNVNDLPDLINWRVSIVCAYRHVLLAKVPLPLPAAYNESWAAYTLSFSPDGKLAYLSIGSDTADTGIYMIDVPGRSLLGKITPATTGYLSITPDGKYLYSFMGSSLSIINLSNNSDELNQVLPIWSSSTPALFSPDSKFAYLAVTNRSASGTFNAEILTLPIDSGDVISTYETPHPSGVGQGAITPDGSHIYWFGGLIYNQPGVIYPPGYGIGILNVDNQTSKFIPVLDATAVVTSPDSKFAYVAEYATNTVLVISTQTEEPVAEVPVGIAPTLPIGAWVP